MEIYTFNIQGGKSYICQAKKGHRGANKPKLWGYMLYLYREFIVSFNQLVENEQFEEEFTEPFEKTKAYKPQATFNTRVTKYIEIFTLNRKS